jgi:hypothetical protein
MGVDGDVACKYTYIIPELALEIAELLVRESFDGSGVNDATVVLDGGIDDVFGNRGFAGTRRSADDYGKALIDEVDSFLLKTVVDHTVIVA